MDSQKPERKIYAIAIGATRKYMGHQRVGCFSMVLYSTKAEAEFIGDKRAYTEFPKSDGWGGHTICISSMPLKIYEGVEL